MPRKYTVSEKVLTHMVEMRSCRKIRVPKSPKYISKSLRVPTAVYDELRTARLPDETLWQTLCRTNKQQKEG